MSKFRVTRAVILLLGSISLLLFVRPALADGVTLAVATTNLAVTEGDSLTVELTLTNKSGAAIFVDTFGFNQTIVSGDISD